MSSVDLPRGIDPALLITQIQSTAPYLFETEDRFDARHRDLLKSPVTQLFFDYCDQLKRGHPLSHLEYFQLCVSCHLLSCGTPVPTDVDNQIRFRLWPPLLSPSEAIQMALWVKDLLLWDYSLLSDRVCHGAPRTAFENEPLSGHLGEWFTLACGAYAALAQYNSPKSHSLENTALTEARKGLFEAIEGEVARHAEIFGSLWNAGDGIECLRASTAIAHNLGDLDRVMDQWKLPPSDPLRKKFYKLSSVPFEEQKKELRYLGRLWVAGELYKLQFETPWGTASLSFENHRHFALRKPRVLRSSRGFLIPIGPFFDDWGTRVAKALTETDQDIAEVTDALVQGWLKLPRPTFGYLRGLAGILKVRPELKKLVEAELRKGARERSKGFEHGIAALGIAEERFKEVLKKRALQALEEIPSTAGKS